MNSLSVKSIAKKWYSLLPFPKEYDQDFQVILQSTPNVEPVSLSEYNWKIHEDDQNLNMVMVLYFLEELKAIYGAKGIPDNIFWETVKEITVYTRRTKEMTGAIGIKRLHMSLLILSARLFRIGRLQFCMDSLFFDIPEKGLYTGEPVLDVHITEDGSLDITACKDSFQMSEEFFARYFPDFRYQYYTCHSWLMDKGLSKFLHKNANILKFQKLFEIFNHHESDTILSFLFQYGLTDREKLKDFPVTSVFAQKIKEHALDGDKFYAASGIRNKSCQNW